MKLYKTVATFIVMYISVGYFSTAIIDYKYSDNVPLYVKILDRTKDSLLQNWGVKLMVAVALTAVILVIIKGIYWVIRKSRKR